MCNTHVITKGRSGWKRTTAVSPAGVGALPKALAAKPTPGAHQNTSNIREELHFLLREFTESFLGFDGK